MGGGGERDRVEEKFKNGIWRTTIHIFMFLFSRATFSSAHASFMSISNKYIRDRVRLLSDEGTSSCERENHHFEFETYSCSNPFVYHACLSPSLSVCLSASLSVCYLELFSDESKTRRNKPLHQG